MNAHKKTARLIRTVLSLNYWLDLTIHA